MAPRDLPLFVILLGRTGLQAITRNCRLLPIELRFAQTLGRCVPTVNHSNESVSCFLVAARRTTALQR